MDLWFDYDGCRFLDVAGSRDVVDECLGRDVYELRSLPEGDALLDLGGLYGECGIWAEKHGLHVLGVEPTLESWVVAEANCRINRVGPLYYNLAVALVSGDIPHNVRPYHPGGSGTASDGVVVARTVRAESIHTLLNMVGADCHGKIHVKMDIEGGELVLFEDLSWVSGVESVRMECHFDNLSDYVESLKCCGLGNVKISGNAPGAIIIAKR